ILVEIDMPTLRITKVDMIKNDEALQINLDLLEERREQEAIQEAKKQSQDGKVLLMLGSATQVSSQETSSTGAMKKSMRKTEASLDLSGKDRMKLQKH
ncbi:hypothetical protein Tco_0899140, partial [Tanacetum coccineum]